MFIHIVRDVATQIADDTLILVVVELDVQWQIVHFNRFLAMRTVNARMILCDMVTELLLCAITFDTFGLGTFEWQLLMCFLCVTIHFVFG